MKIIAAAGLAALALLTPALADQPASEATRAANAAVAQDLPADVEDEEFSSRGFIASWSEKELKDAEGRVVWNFDAYGFVEGEAPPSVNPSLWRHARLLARHGLFRVHERIYQARGFDISNMSIIVGRRGLIVVDPLTSVEAARAALALARASLGEKPVVAVIYTHSHADHFAGVRGVVDQKDVAAGRVRIIAPEGFLEHAVSENIIAGVAMGRRAGYQFGGGLAPGPEGQMTSGIGAAIAGGTRSLLAPTETISRTGETLSIDGVRFVFQLTPNTEAPAEMNFFLPDFGALCLAENANVSMHNVLTPRGALVRDAKIWADYLTEALRLYGDGAEMMFTSHGWPRFGGERVGDFIASHRDAYKYLHDQSVRMMNMGLTGEEIAERIALPEALAGRWFNRGYYGTMRHNSRAVYQRYMGWYDGNPAHLNALPHEASAARYVAAMGGAKKVMKRAESAAEAGDYRWAAELLDRLVFAEPENAKARAALAGAHRQMAYQAESAIWRNLYLSAARELTEGMTPGAALQQPLDYIAATPSAMLFDLLAVRLDPDKALVIPDAAERRSGTPGGERAGRAASAALKSRGIPGLAALGREDSKVMKLNIAFTDRNERFAVTIRNGVLVHEAGLAHAEPDVAIRLSRPQFLFSMFAPPGAAPTQGAALPEITGNAEAWVTFRSLFDAPKGDFEIVRP